MNLQTVDEIVDRIRTYTSLDTRNFESICKVYLVNKKRSSFGLTTQNGLKTLIELRADLTTLSTFLLFRLPDSVRQEVDIDEHVAHLLEGLDGLKGITAMGRVKEGQSIESVRKMFLAMSRDLRVMLIIMALRYAELFELGQLAEGLRKQVARETLEIFVPITGRLGIYTMKRKLEDMCFAYLSEVDYLALQDAFDKRKELQEDTIGWLSEKLSDFLASKGIEAKVSGRIKGKYSTYMKIKRKGVGSIDEIYDLLALRVVVNEQTDCYTVLSLVNNNWQAISGRFKDYIAMPKVNGYRSLHTAVLGMVNNSLRPVEVQIRTEEMHREAEYGVAAHWWYEEEAVKKGVTEQQFVGKNLYQERLQWVKNLVNLQQYLQEDVGRTALSLFSDRIFVMTMSDMVVELPKGSTPLDFGYAISESLGNHCFQAKVNGKVVPLDYELRNGDRVFINKKMEVSPNLYWLSLVQTERAKKAIRKWLLEQGEDTTLNHGIRMINRQLRQFNLDLLDDDYSLLANYEEKVLNFKERKALIVSVGQGEVDVEELVRSVVSVDKIAKEEQVVVGPLAKEKKGEIFVAGEAGFETKIAACCNPSQGVPVIGYVTRGGFISIHQKDCKVLESLAPSRLIEAWWTSKEELLHSVKIEVLVNMANLLTSLSQALKEKNVLLRSFYYDKCEKGYSLVFDLVFKKAEDFQDVLEIWKQQEGVLEVKMLEGVGG